MAKYNLVKFGDKWAVRKNGLFFTSYVDLTEKYEKFLWKRSSPCFGYCLGSEEKARSMYGLIMAGEEVVK